MAAVFLAGASSLVLLLSSNWRWSIIALVVQYIAVFWLISLVWPLGLAASRLIVGWMAGAVLAASRPGELEDSRFLGLPGRLFHTLAAALVWLLVIAITPDIRSWIIAPGPVLYGGLLLFGAGLLHIGMTNNPLRTILGLLTAISGFEIIYASMEASVLLAGLLGVVTLGLALVGSYLLQGELPEEEPE
jgi:hypothetical protein